jgi:hypothetical protein
VVSGQGYRKEEPAGSLASTRDIQSKVFSLQMENFNSRLRGSQLPELRVSCELFVVRT